MHWEYTPYALFLVITAAMSAALALYAWARRSVPGAMPFTLLMLAVAGWSLGGALELGSADLPAKVFWAKGQCLGVVVVPVAWLAFALQYTGQEKWLTGRNLALLGIVPLVTLLLVWTNDLHSLMWSEVELDTSGPFTALDFTYASWFWVLSVYSYLLVLLGALLFIQAFFRSPSPYRGQVVAVLIGALIPWVGSVLYVSGLGPFPSVDLTLFAFALTGLAMAWGLFRFRLLDIAPVAREAVIEGMRDGVIVLDAQNRVVSLNPAAEQIIGRTASEAIGQPAAQVLSGWPDGLTEASMVSAAEPLAKVLAERYRDATEAHAEIVLGEGEAQRTFDLCISPLHDSRGRFTGRLVVLRDISERKRAEERLRLLSSVAEQSSEGIAVSDLEGNLLFANSAFAAMHGYTPEELVGKHLSIFHAPEHMPAVEAANRQIQETGEFNGEVWHIRCDGTVFPTLMHNSLLQDEMGNPIGMIATLRDITERKRAEDALRRERDLAEALGEATAALTATLDSEQVLYRILEQVSRIVPNDAANIMLIEGDEARIVRWRGYEHFGTEEFVSTAVFHVSELPDLQYMVDTKESMVIPDTATHPDWVHTPQMAWIRSYAAAPIVVRGELIGFLNVDSATPEFFVQACLEPLHAFAGHAAAAIENARLFGEAHRRAEELAIALARQEELDHLKDQLIQNVSHELRSPLALIRGYAEMLNDGELGELHPMQQNPVAVIARRARMLGDMVRDITLVLEAEANHPELGPVPLDGLARTAVQDFQVIARQAGLTLEAEIALHLPPVNGSHIYLRRVLDNLLSNAVKFTPARGTITVRVRQEGEQVALEVSDTGIGIPDDQLERIFERFYQVNGSTRRQYGGVGLGLALVEEIVRVCGGRVTVQSQVGEGSTFTILFPIAADTAP